MRINTNIMAMNTQRMLGINNSSMASSTEKLSSGYRINRAADDAAGLMISEKMRSQIRGLTQASANAQDGISLIQAAEGALNETHSILQRMRELAVKGANDVLQDTDRQAVMDEMNQLTKEIDRIAFTTEFNKKTLLDGSLQNNALTARTISGFGVAAGITTTVGTTATGTHTIAVTTAGKRWSATVDAAVDSGDLLEGNIVSFTVDDPSGTTTPVYTYQATGDAEVDSKAITNGLKAALEKLYNSDFNITSSGSVITIEAKEIGVIANTQVGAGITNIAGATVQGSATSAGSYAVTGATPVEGVDTVVAVDGASANVTKANGVYTDSTTGFSFRINDETQVSSAVVMVTTGRQLTFQVGANTGSDQTISLGIRSLSAAGLGIDFLDVSTNVAAQSAVDSIEKAITTVSEQRSALGAIQNRLEHTVANLDTVAENLTAAESRIRDVDMAKEMLNFVKSNILTQAATAMLAQANQAPQTVLQLLR